MSQPLALYIALCQIRAHESATCGTFVCVESVRTAGLIRVGYANSCNTKLLCLQVATALPWPQELTPAQHVALGTAGELMSTTDVHRTDLMS